MIHLKRIWFSHSSREFQSLKSLLQSASNLSELFIAFDNLLLALDDEDLCQLFANRIIHLLILRPTPATPTHLTVEYIPRLFQIFRSVRHLQIDVTNGPLIETIVLSIINISQRSTKLVSLVVEGESKSDELKTDTRQWIINNTYLIPDGKFDAEFRAETNRFLLWM